jgi:hypothetical protein
VRVLEASVEAADLVAVDDFEVLARAARVEREVSLREAFGPRADDVVAFIEQVRRIRWLRPEMAPSGAQVAGLVAEHYAALADYAVVTPRPVRLALGARRATRTLRFGRFRRRSWPR